MSAEHTPGPWEWDISPVNYDPEEETPWLLSTETAERPDCAILSGQIMCYSEADASLIAAAPELLEACKRLMVCMSLAGWGGDDAAISARAAIEKATGVKA